MAVSMQPTMRDIAEAAGVSQPTVSLALRNDARVAPATRKQVLAVAEQLGYRPNPMVAALMAQRRKPNSNATRGTLAVLYVGPRNRSLWHNDSVMKLYAAGLHSRAAELGYEVDDIRADAPDMDADRLAGVLQARGITGLFMAPLPSTGESVSLDWSRFAVATLGHSWHERRLHRSTADQYGNLRLAWAELRRRGHQRIGLAVTDGVDERLDRQWSAAFLTEQRLLPRKLQVPPFLPNVLDVMDFKTWVERYRPEAILFHEQPVAELLHGLTPSVRDGITLVDLGIVPGNNECGVDPDRAAIAAAAVDLIVAQLNRNERGLPASPKTVSIRGHFFPGV
ncbi:MAG: LacI family DNA-binding transcriptional regulator [Verrucomicrobiota bacterium]|nr:LacI family DNA-binding transcriptional regulator [Verrucomicrobiota bacterium]